MPTITPLHQHHANKANGDGSGANVAKATAMVVLFLCSFCLGGLPVLLRKWLTGSAQDTKNSSYVKMLLGLGGGVLLCTTFMHLLPEVGETFESMNLTPQVEVHYAELLMCTGFFLMYLVEECVHVYLHRKEKTAELKTLERSLSIRRGETPVEKPKPDDVEAPRPADKPKNAGHSHIVVDGDDQATSAVKAIRGLLIVLALSVHELFEGLSIGLESSASSVWYMFGAVSAHKLVIAFCIGVELVASGLAAPLTLAYVFVFAVVSPVGVGVGMAVSNAAAGGGADLVSVVLQGLATGTLLYVVFFEILQGERKSGLRQWLALFVGFGVMFGITMVGS